MWFVRSHDVCYLCVSHLGWCVVERVGNNNNNWWRVWCVLWWKNIKKSPRWEKRRRPSPISKFIQGAYHWANLLSSIYIELSEFQVARKITTITFHHIIHYFPKLLSFITFRKHHCIRTKWAHQMKVTHTSASSANQGTPILTIVTNLHLKLTKFSRWDHFALWSKMRWSIKWSWLHSWRRWITWRWNQNHSEKMYVMY